MKIVVIMCVFIVKETFCRNNPFEGLLVRDLPPGGPEELLNILRKEAFNLTAGCEKVTKSDIKLLLFNRKNQTDPIKIDLDHPVRLKRGKKLIIIVHGWLASPTSYGIPELKDAYLKRYDCNVLLLDWYKYSWKRPSKSSCYLPKIAKVVSNFLCLLDGSGRVPLERVHIVAHSLGAQLTALVGQRVVGVCRKKLGRITALDPGGPAFQDRPTSERLDESDANFVDVIHTNQGLIGYWGNCGTVDFYVNCGIIQPNCPVFDFKLRLLELLNLPLYNVCCSHLRALDYMAESINSQEFRAKSCETCPIPCALSLFQTSNTIMGEDCPRTVKGGYSLTTGISPPFSRKIFSFL